MHRELTVCIILPQSNLIIHNSIDIKSVKHIYDTVTINGSGTVLYLCINFITADECVELHICVLYFPVKLIDILNFMVKAWCRRV